MSEGIIWVGLIALGLGVGSYGTIVGAGGGFLLAPFLILLYPAFEPEIVTAISLAVVSANALSGAAAYGHQKRIDYVAAGLFAMTSIPGAVAGALLVGAVPQQAFQISFAVLLLGIAFWLVVPRHAQIITIPPGRRFTSRTLTDAHQHTYRYSFYPFLSAAIGVVIGFISSLFGIGGGIILVPVMILFLRFPAHIATATSTFVLLFTSFAGVTVHLAAGHYQDTVLIPVLLGCGVLVGAQVGAALSLRLEDHQERLSTLLAIALVPVSLRLLAGGLS